MTKDLKNRILENKVLTHDERMEIIKALEQQPSEDCVSRQAVLDTLMKYEKPCDDRQDFYLDSTTEFEEEINELPPVTPTRKVGKWVKKSQYGNDYCSECDYEYCGYGYPKFCPNCGTEMKGESNNG